MLQSSKSPRKPETLCPRVTIINRFLSESKTTHKYNRSSNPIFTITNQPGDLFTTRAIPHGQTLHTQDLQLPSRISYPNNLDENQSNLQNRQAQCFRVTNHSATPEYPKFNRMQLLLYLSISNTHLETHTTPPPPPNSCRIEDHPHNNKNKSSPNLKDPTEPGHFLNTLAIPPLTFHTQDPPARDQRRYPNKYSSQESNNNAPELTITQPHNSTNPKL